MSSAPDRDRDRLLRALQQLLALEVSDVERALDAAAQQIADAMRADKVDVFLHEAATQMLVAGGLTNLEIAERLVLTPGTVANHVESILRRLGFRSRTQVAALFGDPALVTSDVRRLVRETWPPR